MRRKARTRPFSFPSDLIAEKALKRGQTCVGIIVRTHECILKARGLLGCGWCVFVWCVAQTATREFPAGACFGCLGSFWHCENGELGGSFWHCERGEFCVSCVDIRRKKKDGSINEAVVVVFNGNREGKCDASYSCPYGAANETNDEDEATWADRKSVV